MIYDLAVDQMTFSAVVENDTEATRRNLTDLVERLGRRFYPSPAAFPFGETGTSGWKYVPWSNLRRSSRIRLQLRPTSGLRHAAKRCCWLGSDSFPHGQSAIQRHLGWNHGLERW